MIKKEALAIYPNGLSLWLQEAKKVLNEGDVWACKICLENDQVTVKDAVKKVCKNGSNLKSHMDTSLSGHNLHDPKKNVNIQGDIEPYANQFRVNKKAKTMIDLKEREKQVLNTLHRIVAGVINRKGLGNRFCEDPDF